MGSVYVSVTAPWPSFADGRPVLGPRADFSVIDARINALTPDRLEEISESATGSSLTERGQYDASIDVPDDLCAEDEDELYRQAGEKELRERLKQGLRSLAENQRHVSFDFDGRRWTATSGGDTWGDDPSEEYTTLRLLEETGVCEAPVDAEKFTDVALLAATVTVLDDLAALALAAVRKAGVTGAALEAAKAALEDARGDVAGSAATFRRVVDQMTAERDQVAWRWMAEAMRIDPETT